MRMMDRLMTMVLAGGKGERLYPLTQHRAKAAVRMRLAGLLALSIIIH
jgi:ADP-glucose pyrophosphorylase